MKTATINDRKPNGTWKNPKGGMVYYHRLSLSNGDSGTIGTMEEMPERLAIGCEISYEISSEGKIKVASEGGKPFASPAASTGKAFQRKDKIDHLSFAYAYAKDMVIAGKTSQADIEALKTISEQVFNHMCGLFDKTKANP